MRLWLEKTSWTMLILGSLTLGLAPFVPEPHLFEKLRMLFAGTLHRPIDVFDLLMHGAFPALLLLKILIQTTRAKNTEQDK